MSLWLPVQPCRNWYARVAGVIVAAAWAGLPVCAATLEEVAVTATKRPMGIDEVPFGLTVLGAETLDRTGAREFRDYLASVPGVSFSDGGLADAKINIRGLSTDVYSEIRPATAVYLDDTPLTDPGAHFIVQSPASPELVDIDRIEILRGPQGTLYGAGSLGGAIRIVTRQPDPTVAGAAAGMDVSMTEHGHESYEVDALVNVPLSDVTALRAVGYYNDQGGFIDNLGTLRNDVNASLRRGARVAVRMTRPEHLDATLMFAHNERSSPGLNIDNLSLDHYQQRTLMPDAYQDEWELLSLPMEYSSDGLEIVSATSYLDREWRQLSDISGFLEFFGVSGTVQADAQQDLNEFAEEIRIGSDLETDNHWLVGLYYLKRDQELRQTFPAPGFDAATKGRGAAFGAPDNLGMTRTTFDHEDVALFGEWSFLLMRGVQLVVGSRWQHMKEEANSDSAGLLYGGVARTSKHWAGSGFSPNVSASFRPSDVYTLYVTASKGFRTGGPNYAPVPQDLCEESLGMLGLTHVPESYDSDHVWNYEIGARVRSRDERIALSASAFRINWSDVQILGFLSCGTGFVDNAGTARTNGVELELSWRVGEHWTIEGNASYLDAQLEGDVPILGVEGGDRLPGVPQWTVNASLTYQHNITSSVVGYIRTDLQYVDAREGTFVPEGAPRLRAPAYALGNLRLGCEGARWSAALYLRNAWDEYATYARVDDFGLHPSGDWNTVGRPRTAGLRIDWRFGRGKH